jgi:hypothetical protein
MAEAIVVGTLKFVVAVGAKFGASAAASITFAANVVNAATWAALSAGVSAYLSSQRSFPNQGRMLQLGLASDLPRRLQIGRRSNAGILVDWHVKGNKNQFLYMVIYLGEGPMAAPDRIWGDGRIVHNGALTHGVQTELTEYRSPDPRAWVTFYDGRDGQTVDSELNSEFGVGANYRGAGCAYAVVKLLWDPDTTANFPSFAFESPGAHLYDRRKDSTAGGTGAHRYDQPGTWELSDNPAVALDHYILGRKWAGDAKPRMGVGLPADDVPYDRFAALANLCEETVSLAAGGSQQRYEANGFIEADQVHRDVITELCKSMDARPADFGGRVSAISHASSTSVMTISDDDVVDVIPETYQPKRSWAELVGGAQGTYQDPDNAFRPTEYPRVEDATWQAEDGGEAKTVEVSFPFETSAPRAQRLARLFVNRERRQATLSGVYLPHTIELEEGDWFTRTGGRFGAGKVFEVVAPPVLDPNTLGVTISAIEVDPTDSAWSTTDEQAVDIPAGDGNTTPPTIPTPSVTFETITFAQDTYAFTGLKFHHVDWNDGIPRKIEIEIANDVTGSPDEETVQTTSIRAGRQYGTFFGGILPGRSYHVRARAVVGARASAWTSWTQFLALNNVQYGEIGDGTATLGVNVFREDGVTPIVDADAITNLGQAASILGQGALALLNDVSWGSLVTGRPVELTDGRISAGLDANGDLNRNLSLARMNSSNILRFTGGAQFLGDLTADVTGNNQAASILNQGWGATAAQSALDNLYVGIGGNAIIDTDFYLTSTGIHWATDGNLPNRGAQIFNTTDGQRAYQMWSSAATANSQYFRLRTPFVSNNNQQAINVETGDRVGVACRAGQVSGSGVILWIEWRDANGGWIASNSVTGNFGAIGDGQGGRESFSPLSVYADAPAGAKWAFFAVRGYANTGQSLDARVIEPQIVKMAPGQVVIPPYSRGSGAEQGADQTSAHQAASILDQSAWATYANDPANFVQGINAQNALNENALFLDPTYSSGIPAGWDAWVNSAQLTRGTLYNRPLINGDASSNLLQNLGLSKYIYQIEPNKKFKARISWRRNGGTYQGSGMYMVFRDSSNGTTGTARINCATDAPANGVVSTTHDGIQVWEKIIETPANTDRIQFYAMWGWTGFDSPANGSGLSAGLLECSITPLDETERRTDTQTDNADQTSGNQAASILNQGWGATASEADISALAGGAFNAIKDGDAYGLRFGAGSVTSNGVTVSASGGTGPFTYEWTVPTGPGFSISSLTAATVTFSATLSAGQTIDSSATCTITDTSNGLKTAIAVNVFLKAT